MSGMLLNEKWLVSADYGPAVLRLRLLEVQLFLDKANLAPDMRDRARQVALELREAIAQRPCASRADVSAKLSLLMEHVVLRLECADTCGVSAEIMPSANHSQAA